MIRSGVYGNIGRVVLDYQGVRPKRVSSMSPSADTPTLQPRPDDERPDARPFQFTLRKLMIWVAVFSLICGLVASGRIAVEKAREAARAANCQCHLKQLGLALLNYHGTHGCFPPAHLCDQNGKPMHSWRVLILPFVEQQALYGQYDLSEPWNGANNSSLAAASPWGIFQCPSATTGGTALTNYVAVVGPETMWPGSKCTRLSRPYDSDVQTIMLVEITNSDIHWMEPRDLTFEQAMGGIQPESGLGISSEHPSGIVYVTANGQVYVLQRDIDPEELRKLLTVDPSDSKIVRVK